MPTIYLDMDGVLADFDTKAREMMKATREEQQHAHQTGRWPDDKWREILNHQHFFRILPKMPQADELVSLSKRFRDELGYELRVLTAIPRKNDFPEAFQDKIDWMTEHYPGIRVCFGPYAEDKQHHCKHPQDVLVDDRTSNITEWRAKGGTAVHVTKNYEQALEELRTLLESLKGQEPNKRSEARKNL